MHGRTILSAVVVAAVGASVAAPALAAPKPKAIKKSFTHTDATADPTASLDQALGGYGGCDEKIAPFKEKGFTVSLPAKGSLRVNIANKADWALDVRDAKGKVLGFSDGPMPNDVEAVTVKIKAAGTYTIVPCNLGGEPQVAGTWEYKP